MSESTAVMILRKELEAIGAPVSMPSLSIRVKWGQADLVGLGHLRKFLEKYPEVFCIEANKVKLAFTTQAAAPPPKPTPEEAPAATTSAPKSSSSSLGTTPAPKGVRKSRLSPPSPTDGAGEAPEKAAAAGTTFVPKGGAQSPPAKPGAPASEDAFDPEEAAGTAAANGAAKSLAATSKPAAAAKPKLMRASPKQPAAPKGAEGKAAFPPAAAPKTGPPPGKRKGWQEDGLGSEELSSTIVECKTKGRGLELAELASSIAPSEEYRKAVQWCLSLLRAAVMAAWSALPRKGMPPPLLEVCGAVAQGAELEGSDVDVALRLAPQLAPAEREAWVGSLRERLQHSPQAAQLQFGEPTKCYAHTATPLSVQLIGSPKPVVMHLQLAELQLGPPQSRPPTVDGAIGRLCDACEASRALLRLVKLWSVNHGLASEQDGFIGGAAWALLALYFLQKQGLLPPHAALLKGPPQPPKAAPKLADLLSGFFAFLVDLEGSSQRYLSVHAGQERPVPAGCALFIEDPAEAQRVHPPPKSLTEKVGEAQWAQTLEQARKEHTRLTQRPQRWFHWAEVFEPTELSRAKAQRLEPLSQMVASVQVAAPKAWTGKGY